MCTLHFFLKKTPVFKRYWNKYSQAHLGGKNTAGFWKSLKNLQDFEKTGKSAPVCIWSKTQGAILINRHHPLYTRLLDPSVLYKFWLLKNRCRSTYKDTDEEKRTEVWECKGVEHRVTVLELVGLQTPEKGRFRMSFTFVCYEEMKRELKRILIYECRCNERLKVYIVHYE